MATTNPGRFVGGIGCLRVGAPADLIRFTIEDEALKIKNVIVKGTEWGA